MMKSFEVTIENKFSAPLHLSNIRTKQWGKEKCTVGNYWRKDSGKLTSDYKMNLKPHSH